ncbi:MAG: N-6 DNA methylase [Crocosphaera sp.]
MDYTVHNKIVSFIWQIADDCLRDVYVRGKYRDVILPMFVLRRLDCLLEPSKDAVLEEVRFQREEVKLTVLDDEGLRDTSGYVFYNISEWTLQRLVKTATNNRQILEKNFKAYLDGFSDNVKEIIAKFELRNQIKRMVEADVLLDVLQKFIDPRINLSPESTLDPDGNTIPALTNLGMGYVFEELIRKFNEENNEEAGEHFTPREVIHLMTHLLFLPVKEQLPPVITIYDCACGSGGMLTESEGFIKHPDGKIKAEDKAVYLYGKEVNGETYAICQSDMMIKGNNPENIRYGSTLAMDEFAGMTFDFMLSNPPYGKSWKSDQKFILEKKAVLDTRFEVVLTDFKGINATVPAIPRSSDGQLLFLMDMVSKMKSSSDSPHGSRIASVHNGSSLFTGDAGSGESNIRRYIIENDWLEAIIQLPNDLFYNTGITTYIWVLSNHKTSQRKGKVQLIDASQMYRKLRKNLGKKNCEFSPEHINLMTQVYLEFTDGEVAADNNNNGEEKPILRSKIFDNEDFGYYKVTIERPLRLAVQVTKERVKPLRFFPALQDIMEWCYEKWGDAIYTNLGDYKQAITEYIEKEEMNLTPKNKKALFDIKTWNNQRSLLTVMEQLYPLIGDDLYLDFNQFLKVFDNGVKSLGLKLSSSEKNQIINAISWREETAEKVIKKVHKLKREKLEQLLTHLETSEDYLQHFGYFESEKKGEYIEYESDSELRDTENVPLTDNIHNYFMREVLPHVSEAWINWDKTNIGYEISFNKYFYQHQPLRSLEEVTAEILELEAKTDGLLKRIVGT